MLLGRLFSSLWRTSRAAKPSILPQTCAFSSQLSQDSHQLPPRRSVLYVPANDEKKLSKVPSLRADSVVLDIEDGVAQNQKEAARVNIQKFFSSASSTPRKEMAVRVNSIQFGALAEDLRCLSSLGPSFSTVYLPKVDSVYHLETFASNLKEYRSQDTSSLRLIIYCESGQALHNLADICARGLELREKFPIVLEGVVFGSDDFCADLGITRTNEARELLYARQHFVTIVKSLGLQAIDMVYIDFKDLEGLEKQSIEGASFGFTGKQIIHPGQIDVVQKAFSPSKEKITWAKELLAEFEKHQQEGKGAFTFRGHMIDMPLVLQARNILQVAENIEV